MAPWAGKRIHRADTITLYSFEPEFFDQAVAALERRNTMTLSITERELYLDLNGTSVSSGIHAHPIRRDPTRAGGRRDRIGLSRPDGNGGPLAGRRRLISRHELRDSSA